MSEYYTVQQVAEKLQVTEKTVYRWVRDGELAAQRMGRSQKGLRISQEALDAFMRPAYEERRSQKVA